MSLKIIDKKSYNKLIKICTNFWCVGKNVASKILYRIGYWWSDNIKAYY